MADVLIIDDDQSLCNMMVELVKNLGHQGYYSTSLHDGVNMAVNGNFDVVVLDVQMPDGNGLEVLPQIKDAPSSPEVIILTGAGTEDGAELAIKNGAWDYLQKPLSPKEIGLPLKKVFQYRDTLKETRKPAVALKIRGIVGSSQAIRASLNDLAQAANSNANVLITGETGTGKELFAKAIHANSRLAKKTFIVVDCASLPETLIESSLFGHEKGAFTGADRTREGLIQKADGGTLFLDEIGELGLSLQKTFLRVLEEKKFHPLGGTREISSDFRLICATNRNLEKRAGEKKFRKDLLYRLQSLQIELPPLRDRLDDIKELAVHHKNRICDRYGAEAKGFSSDFISALRSYDWPGNVRELVNTLESCISTAFYEPLLFPQHLPTNIRVKMARASVLEVPADRATGFGDDAILPPDSIPPYRDFRDAILREPERKYFQSLMAYTHGNVSEACRISGLGRTWLYTVLKKYKIDHKNWAKNKSKKQ